MQRKFDKFQEPIRMVPLNLKFKLTCGKLMCIFHFLQVFSVDSQLNNPAHAQRLVVSISCAIRGMAHASIKTHVFKFIIYYQLYQLGTGGHIQKAKPV